VKDWKKGKGAKDWNPKKRREKEENFGK